MNNLCGSFLCVKNKKKNIKYNATFFNDNVPENISMIYCEKGEESNFICIVNKIRMDPDHYNLWANGLLKMIECNDVLVFDQIEIHKYYHASLKAMPIPPHLRKIETDERKKQKKDNVPFLESPNVSIGLSASILSFYQKRNSSAAIFCSIVESVLDVHSLIAFEDSVKQIFDQEKINTIKNKYGSLLKNQKNQNNLYI